MTIPGWDIFVQLLETVLLTLYHWTSNSGVAIILFTVIARVIILPLTLTSLQSSRKMQELQPQVKEIQRKYGKDPQKLNEETMKLYREYKVNPAGGCLPMVLQLPIFFGVYQAVLRLTQHSVASAVMDPMLQVLNTSGINVTSLIQASQQNQLHGGFLWLPNLGDHDPYLILPIISVVFQLVVQLMAMPRIQDPQQKAMSQSMLILPLVFGYIGFTFPSGAVLYWVTGSLLSMIQQYVISGWGSLANYLKFLPTTPGLFPPSTAALATASSSAVASSSSSQEAQAEPTAPLSFWDVLQPLRETSGASDAAPEMSEVPSAAQPSQVLRRPSSQIQGRRRSRPRR